MILKTDSPLEYIGHVATFYIPRTKALLVEDRCHRFFIEHYDAYTRESSEITGYWRKQPGHPIFADENVKYVVSFRGKKKVAKFVNFLSEICAVIEEECLYLTMGFKSYLVKPKDHHE